MRPVYDCPKESFPTGIRELETSNKINAYKYSWAKDSSFEICDLKLWFNQSGKGWYTTNSKIKSLINNEYGGILNTQNKQNIVVGNKLYLYGLSPSVIMSDLYLSL